ncbi:hypothetical protein SPURM210S_03794 [Streptomyces purpurascens]
MPAWQRLCPCYWALIPPSRRPPPTCSDRPDTHAVAIRALSVQFQLYPRGQSTDSLRNTVLACEFMLRTPT